MGMKYEFMIYVAIALVIVLPFIKLRKKQEFKKGVKVANSSFVAKSKTYKRMVFLYRFLVMMVLICLLASVFMTCILIARPYKNKTEITSFENRDIFLCMDISDSVDEVNLEMCESFRTVIDSLNGERIGISVFNGRTVTLVPLTTDYEYVLDQITLLEESIQLSIDVYNNYYMMPDDFTYSEYYFKYVGTLVDYGSSFIGDGLASCLFSFPDLNEDPDRARVIIFTTDNMLNGVPLVTIDEACDMCARHGVEVFALAPDFIEDERNFKAAIERTGGSYYRVDEFRSVEKMIEAIEETDTTIIETVENITLEHPELPFILLTMSLTLYYIAGKAVRL